MLCDTVDVKEIISFIRNFSTLEIRIPKQNPVLLSTH